jgi:hypothetical protein
MFLDLRYPQFNAKGERLGYVPNHRVGPVCWNGQARKARALKAGRTKMSHTPAPWTLDSRCDLLAALEWYVENDDTNDTEDNRPWLDGRDRACAAIAKAKGQST